jgi:hypothetical protein
MCYLFSDDFGKVGIGTRFNNNLLFEQHPITVERSGG